MKKYIFNPLLIGLALFASIITQAQTPQKLSYQAVVRGSDGTPLADQQVGMRISLLQGSATGSAVYTETIVPTTSSSGLVSIEIGATNPSDFEAIDWAAGPYFIQTETDLNGGTNYTILGTSQLLSVPYALQSNKAKVADSVTNISADLPAFEGWDQDESDDFSGDYDDLSNKPASFNDADADPMNELQTLEIDNNTLAISDGNTVTLPEFSIGTGDITSTEIANNTIINADISSLANIGISKILGSSGIEFSLPTGFTRFDSNEAGTKTLTSITMSIPATGYVLVITSGYVNFFNRDRTMNIGVSTNTTTLNGEVRLGYLDGSDNSRYQMPYTSSYVFPVAAGTRTFYALASGSSTFDTGVVNVSPRSLIGIFIPKRY
ncbi:MAG: hypothetical protein AAF519_17205 [Bacteroidota bacterium]